MPPYNRGVLLSLVFLYGGGLIVFSPGRIQSQPAAVPPALSAPPLPPAPAAAPVLRAVEPPPMIEAEKPTPPPPLRPSVLPAPFARPAAVREPVRGFVLVPDKPEYYHDQFVEFTLRTDSDEALEKLKNAGPFRAWVEKGGRPVSTVGEMASVRMNYLPEEKVFFARWPVPWNAPDGEYDLKVSTLPAGLPRLKTGSFRILSRPVQPLPPGFGVLTLEGRRSLYGIPGPDGVRSIGGMPAWAEFMGADALFVQGAESNGFDGKLTSERPWHTQSFQGIRDLGDECHRRGMKLGVYVLCFMVGGPRENVPDYAYGWYFDKGKVTYGLDLPRFRGASITDPKRPADIIAMHRKFADMPEVDYLGLDYIRPAFGGSELAEDFAREFPDVVLPTRWKDMTPQERMVWVSKGRHIAPSPAQRKEPKFVLSEQWFWYRAHRTAQVVRRIVGGLEGKKPVWAFTLSWQKGWEHGQDPVMFRDAGVDMDSVMLYEADRVMFNGLVGQWGAYSRQDQLNLIPGNTVDWILHQRTTRPAGPEEMMNRMLEAALGFHTDRKPAKGLFLHDIHRALVGRKGPYKTQEWMLAAGAALTELRHAHRSLPYELVLELSTSAAAGVPIEGSVSFAGESPRGPVTLRSYSAPDTEVEPQELFLSEDVPSAPIRVLWKPGDISSARANRSFVAVRAHRPDVPAERCQIRIRYFQGEKSHE